ncbi:MAG: TetR/AcrR family transcriptional regulator [Capsulimonas sp.]|uniref:TetR/AcrR family transcriptional regulator n=1 Tax=Capsulimonas sp. TaxID=2494211 RepID=UPI0032656D3B
MEMKTRIIVSAIELLSHGGRDAVTTRAVADAAGVQAPAIYRLFGDKNGLLDAVAEHGFQAYLREKSVRKPGQDPVEDLRFGWDLHVEFGLSHAAIYLLMYADPRPGAKSSAAEAGYRVLQEHIRRVAAAGRLRISEERAADLFHASGCGTVLTLLGKAEGQRDMHLSEIAREAAIAAITTDLPAFESSGPVAAAVALRAVLPDIGLLSEGERALLYEWLNRLAAIRS